MTDNVNKPRHYQGKYGMESIEIIDNFIGDLKGKAAWSWGNTIKYKYLVRFQKKNGLEDLKKAKKNLGWLIEEEERKNGLKEPESPYCPRGVPGISCPGAEGSDGRTQFLHIAFANSSDGYKNFTTGRPPFVSGGVYIGVYVDYNPEDSQNPDDYNWQQPQKGKGK